MNSTGTTNSSTGIRDRLLSGMSMLDEKIDDFNYTIAVEEYGTVTAVTDGLAEIDGLPGIRSQELVQFSGGEVGIAFNLDESSVSAVLLDRAEGLRPGMRVVGTGRTVDVPVGEGVLGRTIDSLGRPLDGGPRLSSSERLPVEREAPGIMLRSPVTEPVQTGLQVVDALIPVGRGQRELIVGDRQTGKTAIAIDTIINQRGKGMLCIYCAVGQRASAVARTIEDLRQHGALEYTVVIMAPEDDPPGMRFIAPYAATAIGEYFMEQGRDALVVYDDLTKHARAYREISLMLRRPPAREAYPGDIFYIHSRMLERATHLRKENGSLTALPIIETQAQNMSAYIPTNLISITDGQIYVSPQLFQQGVLPAIDVGKSVSRVGGKTQLSAYKKVAGHLRLSYSQFQELETFSRFGTRLDEKTRKTLDRGRRVREIFKQQQYEPIPTVEQIGVLVTVNEGLFDQVELDRMSRAIAIVRKAVREELSKLAERIEQGEKLSDSDVDEIRNCASHALEQMPAHSDDNGPDATDSTEENRERRTNDAPNRGAHSEKEAADEDPAEADSKNHEQKGD